MKEKVVFLWWRITGNNKKPIETNEDEINAILDKGWRVKMISVKDEVAVLVLEKDEN